MIRFVSGGTYLNQSIFLSTTTFIAVFDCG